MSDITLTTAEIALLVEHVEEWQYIPEEYTYCPECDWRSDCDATERVHGRAILRHKPGCAWKALLERLEALYEALPDDD